MSEKTAEAFQNKSDEEIIEWMIKHLSPEQIKSCLQGDIPDVEIPTEPIPTVPIVPPSVPSVPSVPGVPGVPVPDKRYIIPRTVDDLRRFCQNKRYVIHKIVDDKVYFWFYLINKEQWQYSIEPLENFPTKMGEEAEECGEDTNITDPEVLEELKYAYNKNVFNPNERFSPNNEGQPENEIFNQVKQQYKQTGINDDWEDVLLTALNIQQRAIRLPKLLDALMSFAPVLIESVKGKKVNYYYLQYKDREFSFEEANLDISKFKSDLNEIADDLNNSGFQDLLKSPEQIQDLIREAARKIDPNDIDRIIKIYEEFPLSENSMFFMKDLFGINQFGKNNNDDTNSVDLNNYVRNKFGEHTARMFRAQVMSNKYGTKTIGLVAK
jgi:hypothetical protein